MKTTIVTLSLLATSFAFAAPAAAECVHPDSSTNACVSLDDPSHQSVAVGRHGVGGAEYYRSEFTFMGTTYESSGAFVYTNGESPLGFNYVSYSSFCMGNGGACWYQDDTVWTTTAAGTLALGLSQSGNERVLCYYGDAVGFGCVAF